MASTSSATAKGRNFYTEAMNDPEMLARRKKRQEEMDASIQAMLESMPGRLPTKWSREDVMHMDRFCLENGKRCIMWDDEGAGFFLMLRWDWLRNRPAVPATPEEGLGPGWWHNIKPMMQAPLLDATVPDEQLGAWVDKHTMRVHAGLLDKLHLLRQDGQSGGLVLDHPYWQELQQLPPGPQTQARQQGE